MSKEVDKTEKVEEAKEADKVPEESSAEEAAEAKAAEEETSASSADEVVEHENGGEQPNASEVSQEEIKHEQAGKDAAKSKNKKPMIIAIVCVVVVALVACIAVGLVLAEKDKQAHTPVPISFTFEAAGYDSETGSGVPVHIEGVDLDDQTVSETVLVDAGSPGLELLRGSYDITIAGSPVTGSGGIYAVPDTVTHIEINEDDAVIDGESYALEGEEGSAIELPVVTFTAIKPQNVTDDQIAAIKTWMGEVGFSEELITKFSDLIVADRKAGIAKAEEEALAAWRTKVSGKFTGTGMGAGTPSSRISCSLNGNKLTIRGPLNSSGGSFLSGTEWHFILTDQTRYTHTEEVSRSTSKSDFIQCFPNSFVALTIDVQDGYVLSMDTHA